MYNTKPVTQVLSTKPIEVVSTPTSPRRLQESMSRGCVPSLASVFKSANHALKELVDNAVNYRASTPVQISIEITPNMIRVENIGGRGMSIEHIANFISWGSGEEHASHEISQYRVGGKAAINYLGEGFRLWCRMTQSQEHWFLEDLDFSSRTYLKDYGEVSPIEPYEIPKSLRLIETSQGYVRLEVVNPNPKLRLDCDSLSRDLGNTYKPLIESGEVQIRINGETAKPTAPLLDEEIQVVDIAINLEGIHVVGWVGKLARGPRQPRPGLTMYSKGRRILEAEWMGCNPFAKGSLSSFYGELVLSGITLNVDKSDYVERGTILWAKLGKEVLRQAAPVLDELKGQGNAVRITDRDRRLAKRVKEELELLLEEEGGDGEETTIVEEVVKRIIKRPTTVRVPTMNEGGGSGRTFTRREVSVEYETEKREVSVGGFPEVIIDAWHSSARSIMRVENGRRQIVINKSHPAYSMANARFVIAECVLSEVLGNRLHETSEYRSEIDQLLATWASKEEDSEEI